MSQPDYVTFFVEKSKEPGFSFGEMRRIMEAAGVPEPKIQAIMRAVDNEIIKRGIEESGLKKYYQRTPVLVGAILMSISVVMALAAFFMTDGALIYITILPGTIGLGLIVRNSINRQGNSSQHGMPRARGRWKNR